MQIDDEGFLPRSFRRPPMLRKKVSRSPQYAQNQPSSDPIGISIWCRPFRIGPTRRNAGGPTDWPLESLVSGPKRDNRQDLTLFLRMRNFSVARWDTLLKILSSTHGELICRMCKACESLVQAMFCGTLDAQSRFEFEDLDETQMDIGTEYLLNSI